MPFSNGFLLSLSLCLDIGIANIAMLTLAMQRGFVQGLWLGLGTCFGDLFYAILALAGMTVLLQYEPVRWVLWLGGSVMLVWFAFKMLKSALGPIADPDMAGDTQQQPALKAFGRGMFLAMSSPSAILWFAAVGGALISRSGAGDALSAAQFLSGFFLAGVVWTLGVCTVGAQGGRLMGARLLKASYLASAVIFCYFAGYVILSGYREFFPAGALGH